ncbi:protein COFACTOR ASSEMBLY OF COMPLEX C SUBUNIT B CCB1, chloroplastic [Cynara cardunculus var. scolymus]|uniref:Uncharacterized protein n=1 Tax=Cynara cardunculus var. scolymus TaxID=59895 RepID=A0A118JRN4_CYNCS|nr:protein COFACTOR ASSEMBLY OF COMPLEX C SUBUNIT B CCB1, chloroplastic [Cynara cardunculus var. scolymus]KVH87849.1 Protein of unknown function DUF3529 [Cynara cardunculus var. scolymus]
MAVAKASLLLLLPSKLEISRQSPAFYHHHFHNQKSWGLNNKSRRGGISISSSLLATIHPVVEVAEAASVGYSSASYYTSLGLFVISVPGLWSLIKRSVKSKVVQKTFIEEEKNKGPNQVAGEILSFFTRNNFMVLDKGETITFEGMMVPSRGQAALLTFCTCISMASVALVLTITVPDVGNNWFSLTLLSPLA